MAADNGSNVKWPVFVPTIIGVIGLGWIAWQIHASQPHHGAVRHNEFERIIEQVDAIDAKVDNVSEDLAAIKATLGVKK